MHEASVRFLIIIEDNNELQNASVINNGYLEGLTWDEFFNDFKIELKGIIQNTDRRKFYRDLFWIYKRILWSFSEVRDENLKSLKKFDSKNDRAYQNTEVKGDFGHLNVSVKNALGNWTTSKQNAIKQAVKSHP